MKNPAITRINFLKTADFCAVRRSNLPFINPFGYTIDSKRACLGVAALNALFYFKGGFVCVHDSKSINCTYAILIQTHVRPSETARASSLFSLSTIWRLAT